MRAIDAYRGRRGDSVEPRNETARIEGFSDAVFAIAITALVLGLDVPAPGGPGLLTKLLAKWPEYLAFLATFGTIAIIWIYHQKLFTAVKRADHTLLLLNSLLLLGVVVLPYPTVVLARYGRGPDSKVAAMFHTGVFVVIAMCFNFLWRHVSFRNRLLDPRTDPRMIRIVSQSLVGVQVLYLMSFVIASVSPVLSSACNAGLALFFAIPKWNALRDPFVSVEPGTPEPRGSGSTSADLAAHLGELGRLRQQGTLDEEEFTQAKARVLRGG